MLESLLAQTRSQMAKAIDITRGDLTSIRSGRASPALIENIMITAYGGSQRLKLMEMATITTMDARSLVIAPYDPSVIAEIERGILEANVGLTPIVDGEIIRINIPPLSAERRGEYLKLARTKLEAGKVMVRQVRQEAMKDLAQMETAKEISEDEQKHGEKLVQELTDEMIAELEALGEKKEQELLQV